MIEEHSAGMLETQISWKIEIFSVHEIRLKLKEMLLSATKLFMNRHKYDLIYFKTFSKFAKKNAESSYLPIAEKTTYPLFWL